MTKHITLTPEQDAQVDDLKSKGMREWVAVATVLEIEPESEFTVETKGTPSMPLWGYIVRIG